MYKPTLFLIILLSFLVRCGQAQETLNAETRSQMVSMAEAFMQKTKVPGLSIAIRSGHKTLYAQGFGMANSRSNRAMHIHTRLRTASVAKVITATALGILATEGKLDFDAPIKHYVPYIPDAYAHLTTRQLAGHTSGVGHRPKGEAYKRKQYHDIKATALLMKEPPLFEADTDYKYSTHAFNFLGAVIEGASGKPYSEFMEESIFGPLEMSHTAPENINALTQKDAELYSVNKGKVRRARLTNGSYKVPGAGFRSTPSDLVNLMKAYTNGMISKDVVAEMFRSHELKNGQKTFVGIGWRSGIDPFGNRVIEHAGSWHGARTVLVHYPEEDLNISIMVNADCPVLIEETAHLFAQVFRSKKQATWHTKRLEKKIKINLKTQENEEIHEGTLTLEGNSGFLRTGNKDFLSATPIFYLGSSNDYALATAYGLLYLQLKNDSELQGHIFNYFNRSDKNPTTGLPLATLSSNL